MLFFIGRYNKYRHINWDKVDRLIFVCKGNICRSPFAEALARTKGLNSMSCGTDAGTALPANASAVAAACRKGVDLSGHKSRSFADLALNEGDLFVVMEPGQVDIIKDRYGKQAECTLLGIWHEPSLPYIHDPYMGSPCYFDRCFHLIEDSIEGMIRGIKSS